MIKEIIDGVVEALANEFGDGYEIYTEEVQQGLKEPCFSVKVLKPSSAQSLGNRYYRTTPLCVHYFAKSRTNAKAECIDILERLTSCLEYINVAGDLTRGTEMSGEIVDGVLSFFVNYDMFVVKGLEEKTSMDTMTQTTEMKG